jgi:hypothetical protein
VIWLGIFPSSTHCLRRCKRHYCKAWPKVLKLPVRVDRDPQHLGIDPFVEALHHAIRLRRARLSMAILSPKLGAGSREGWVKRLLLSV